MFCKQAGFATGKVILAMIALLLSVLIITLFYRSNALINVQLARIQEDTGLAISYQQVDYRPWQGQLSLEGVRVETKEKAVIFSEKMTLQLAFSSLWQEKVQFSTVVFTNADIRVDPEKKQLPLLTLDLLKKSGAGAVEFKMGKFTFLKKEDNPDNLLNSLPFQQAVIDTGIVNGIRVFASGELQTGEWSYEGLLDSTLAVLKGRLRLDELPLAALNPVLFNASPIEPVEGSTNGELKLGWSAGQGLRISGDVSVSRGEFYNSLLRLNWKSIRLKGVKYSSSDEKWQVKTLHFLSPGVESGKGSLLDFLPLVRSALDWEIEKIVATDAILTRTGTKKAFPEQVESANVEILLEEKSASYHLQGRVLPSAELIAEGTVDIESSSPAHQFSVKLDKLVAGKGGATSRFGKYNIEGHRLSLNFTGTETGQLLQGRGHLQTVRPDRATVKNDHFHRLALDLMMDSRNKIDTSFAVKSKQQKTLGGLIVAEIEKQWDSSGEKPFRYLSKLEGVPAAINPIVTFVPGQSEVDVDIANQMQALVVALKQRPSLKLTVEGRASKEEDWIALSSIELEKTLYELYSAIKKDPVNQGEEIPEQVRNHLVEQMYLRAQKQKLPEVGEQSEQQRVRVAEKWLLANWPYDHSALEQLASDRAKAIIEALIHSGVEAERVRLLRSTVDTDTEGLASKLGVESF